MAATKLKLRGIYFYFYYFYKSIKAVIFGYTRDIMILAQRLDFLI